MYVDPNILDYGLDYISTYTDIDLLVCYNEPDGSYATAQTYRLGVKENPSLSAVQDWLSGGRKITVEAFTNGVGEVTGTVDAIALVDNTTSSVIVSKGAINSMGIINGESFSVAGIDIILPDALVAYFADSVLEGGLDYLISNLEAIWLFSANPGLTYSATNRLGYKNSPAAGAISNYSPGGRQFLISAFSDGVNEADGYARFFSLVNNTGNEIMVTGQLGRPMILESSGSFALSEFGCSIPNEL